MARLRAAGLDTRAAHLRQPVLGICLGMQLLFERSEEGDVACLGILPGRVGAWPRHPTGRAAHGLER
jgi:glutamine amidotransferase